jgi:acetylornithine deacetylase/succinyl-diaminopimelate desuccinylase-like protein
METVEAILSELIRIDTTNPPGNEMAAAEYLAALFRRYGIPHRIVEAAPGRASFIARLGEGPRRLLFLSHTDVVPAGSGWDFPPFCGEIRDGFVLGRGALDNKNLVAAEAHTLIRLAAEKRKLNGTLIFVAAADEEAGGRFGMQYLVENFPQEIAADFAVNEGAPEPFIANGHPLYFIQVGEKGIAQSRLVTRGRAAHGSVPTLGENAVVKMAKAIGRLAAFAPPVRLLPEVEELLAVLARYLGLPAPSAAELEAFLARVADRGFREYLRALTRLTISPNVVHGGTRVNVVPDRCEALVDVRLLPGQTKEEVEALLREVAGPEVEAEVISYHPPSRSPVHGEGYELLCRTLARTAGAAACLPCLSTGATDSRFLRRLRIPAYGVSPWQPRFDPALREAIHGPNERIDLESLDLYSRFLYELAVNYLG